MDYIVSFLYLILLAFIESAALTAYAIMMVVKCELSSIFKKKKMHNSIYLYFSICFDCSGFVLVCNRYTQYSVTETQYSFALMELSLIHI